MHLESCNALLGIRGCLSKCQVSADAKDLIKKLLELKPTDRYTAEQAGGMVTSREKVGERKTSVSRRTMEVVAYVGALPTSETLIRLSPADLDVSRLHWRARKNPSSKDEQSPRISSTRNIC